jgi:methylated-DNA-[protein]-cysteine S-methyltransferase
MTILWSVMPSPLGELLLSAAGSDLIGVHFPGQRHDRPVQPDWQRDDRAEILATTQAQLDEYFGQRRQRFDLRLQPRGTPFQQSVWAALLEVPFGRTTSYGAIAARIGRPRAVRAVGAAVGANPIGIIVPCHRIVGTDGSLTGYAGGLDRKIRLLELEGALLA